jgi:hypothetical protein
MRRRRKENGLNRLKLRVTIPMIKNKFCLCITNVLHLHYKGITSVLQMYYEVLQMCYNKQKTIKISKPTEKVEPVKTNLSSIINSSGTKGYFSKNYMDDPDNLEGISNPNMPF